MSLSFLSVTSISFLMLCLFLVAFVGYALGRVKIQGVSLGTAGVFVVALLFIAISSFIISKGVHYYEE